MASIKYDFTTCCNAYDFSQSDYEEIYPDFEPTALDETCEDILRHLLIECGLEEAPKYVSHLFPDPVKLLITRKNKVRKTLPVTPKFINFNKTQMAKHPNIDPNTAKIFKSVFDMMSTLNSEKACREHLEKLRWNGEPICPHCGSQRENHYKIKGRTEEKFRYKCKDCRLPFTVTLGTIFEKSTIPLQKWFMTIYLFTTNKKGISSHQLMRDIGVTQKSAWFMLSRIRNSIRCRVDFEFDGITQIDETYVGGKNKNRKIVFKETKCLLQI